MSSSRLMALRDAATVPISMALKVADIDCSVYGGLCLDSANRVIGLRELGPPSGAHSHREECSVGDAVVGRPPTIFMVRSDARDGHSDEFIPSGTCAQLDSVISCEVAGNKVGTDMPCLIGALAQELACASTLGGAQARSSIRTEYMEGFGAMRVTSDPTVLSGQLSISMVVDTPASGQPVDTCAAPREPPIDTHPLVEED